MAAELDRVKKENFNLKLQIYYLEEHQYDTTDSASATMVQDLELQVSNLVAENQAISTDRDALRVELEKLRDDHAAALAATVAEETAALSRMLSEKEALLQQMAASLSRLHEEVSELQAERQAVTRDLMAAEEERARAIEQARAFEGQLAQAAPPAQPLAPAPEPLPVAPTGQEQEQQRRIGELEAQCAALKAEARAAQEAADQQLAASALDWQGRLAEMDRKLKAATAAASPRGFPAGPGPTSVSPRPSVSPRVGSPSAPLHSLLAAMAAALRTPWSPADSVRCGDDPATAAARLMTGPRALIGEALGLMELQWAAASQQWLAALEPHGARLEAARTRLARLAAAQAEQGAMLAEDCRAAVARCEAAQRAAAQGHLSQLADITRLWELERARAARLEQQAAASPDIPSGQQQYQQQQQQQLTRLESDLRTALQRADEHATREAALEGDLHRAGDRLLAAENQNRLLTAELHHTRGRYQVIFADLQRHRARVAESTALLHRSHEQALAWERLARAHLPADLITALVVPHSPAPTPGRRGGTPGRPRVPPSPMGPGLAATPGASGRGLLLDAGGSPPNASLAVMTAPRAPAPQWVPSPPHSTGPLTAPPGPSTTPPQEPPSGWPQALTSSPPTQDTALPASAVATAKVVSAPPSGAGLGPDMGTGLAVVSGAAQAAPRMAALPGRSPPSTSAWDRAAPSAGPAAMLLLGSPPTCRRAALSASPPLASPPRQPPLFSPSAALPGPALPPTGSPRPHRGAADAGGGLEEDIVQSFLSRAR
ncbi:hypothetical protein PAPYR_8684 [Paratrimastix pyriformis]|uniref:Centrosomin N-terminal motif 1 domain-containing protein n=1 Tax=Paratrimastix pyriformis TaxID=342808 RepID=A0ABQ8UA20_9EUKA|nr:hypothetical protein PAPYR_8684 [Paratrimastix pyriformis]